MTACLTNSQQDNKESSNLTEVLNNNDTLRSNSIHNSVVFKETIQENDTVENKNIEERLRLIRENFRRINSKTAWTTIKNKDLWQSTEGGEAKYYYTGDTIEKIIVRQFGEMGQILTEYYFHNGDLSFVFEKSVIYNRPYYWDSTKSNENNDNQTFDFDKSEIVEVRSYFDRGKLIHQVKNQDLDTPFPDEYLLEEQERLTEQFDKLVEIIKE